MLTESELVQFIKEKYNPLAIILHGSKASSRSRPHSDWDLVLLVEKDTQTEQVILNGSAVDMEAIKPDIDDNRILNEIGDAFYSARVIFDTDEVGKKFVERVHKLAAQGYKITPAEIEAKRIFIVRRINRLIDAETQPIEFFYHFSIFLQRSMNYYFQVKGMWSKSIYEAVEYIKDNDLEFYKELNFAVSNVSNNERLESSKRIYKQIFNVDFES